MENLTSSPDISFVIAAFNAADTIEAAVQSALDQQGVTLEVIVVDDRSADDTIPFVEAIAAIDPRVRLLALEENRGPGGARNAGIEAATGRWIAVLDSDDVIRPERSACMMCRAEAANADIAVDNLDVVYTDGRPMETMFPEEFLEERPVLTLEDFISSNILFRSTFNFGYMKPMFRRDFLNNEALRFREDIRIGEDYILLASALAAGGLRHRTEAGLHLQYPRRFDFPCPRTSSRRSDDAGGRRIPEPLHLAAGRHGRAAGESPQPAAGA